jgi:hypothetical protein
MYEMTDRKDQWLGMGSEPLGAQHLTTTPRVPALIYILYLEYLLINSEENNLLLCAGRLTAIVK